MFIYYKIIFLVGVLIFYNLDIALANNFGRKSGNLAYLISFENNVNFKVNDQARTKSFNIYLEHGLTKKIFHSLKLDNIDFIKEQAQISYKNWNYQLSRKIVSFSKEHNYFIYSHFAIGQIFENSFLLSANNNSITHNNNKISFIKPSIGIGINGKKILFLEKDFFLDFTVSNISTKKKVPTSSISNRYLQTSISTGINTRHNNNIIFFAQKTSCISNCLRYISNNLAYFGSNSLYLKLSYRRPKIFSLFSHHYTFSTNIHYGISVNIIDKKNIFYGFTISIGSL